MNLEDAQRSRRARGDQLAEEWADARLNAVGLTDSLVLGTANVSPSDRNKLKGILARLRRVPQPFRQCMRDLRKHKPEWTEERRRKTCGTLKALTGRKMGTNASNMSDDLSECVLLDEGVINLLELADLSMLKEDE